MKDYKNDLYIIVIELTDRRTDRQDETKNERSIGKRRKERTIGKNDSTEEWDRTGRLDRGRKDRSVTRAIPGQEKVTKVLFKCGNSISLSYVNWYQVPESNTTD